MQLEPSANPKSNQWPIRQIVRLLELRGYGETRRSTYNKKQQKSKHKNETAFTRIPTIEPTVSPPGSNRFSSYRNHQRTVSPLGNHRSFPIRDHTTMEALFAADSRDPSGPTRRGNAHRITTRGPPLGSYRSVPSSEVRLATDSWSHSGPVTRCKAERTATRGPPCGRIRGHITGDVRPATDPGRHGIISGPMGESFSQAGAEKKKLKQKEKVGLDSFKNKTCNPQHNTIFHATQTPKETAATNSPTREGISKRFPSEFPPIFDENTHRKVSARHDAITTPTRKSDVHK